VLSQVKPGDKPFIGFLHDESKNCSLKLSRDVSISMGYIRGGAVLGSKSGTPQSLGFGACRANRAGLPGGSSDCRDYLPLRYLRV